MKSRYPQPKWLDLYLIVGSFLGAFWLVIRSRLTETGQTVLEVGLLFLFGMLMFGWLTANEIALMDLPEEKSREMLNREHNQPNAGQEPKINRVNHSNWSFSTLIAAIIAFLGDIFHRLS